MQSTRFRRLNHFSRLACFVRNVGAGRHGRRARALVLAAAWCLVAGSLAVSAQNVQYTSKSADLGLRSDFKVNPSTHALELRIPLAEYPGRAGTSIPISLNYSSKVWRMKYATYLQQHSTTGVAAIYGERSQAGWTVGFGFPVIDTEPSQEKYDGGGGPTGGVCQAGGTSGTPAGTSSCCWIDRVMVRMPDGSSHELRSTDTPVCLINSSGGTSITPPDDMYAVDGSRLRYRKSTNELFMPDGSRYVLGGAPGGQYIDRHGNVLYHDGTNWRDTLGRAIPPLPLGGGDFNYVLPGVGNTTVNYTLRWRSLSAPDVLSPGEQLSWTTSPSCPNVGSQTHANFLFGGGDGCIVSHYLFDPQVLYQVVLPTGQAYTFNYNRFGEVSKVTYPTGGYERFEYGRVDSVEWVNEPYASANRGVVARYVSASGSGGDEVLWLYPSGTAGGLLHSQFTQGEVTPDGTLTERLMHRGGGGGAGFGYSSSDPMGGTPYEERVWSAPDPANNNNRRLLRRKLKRWEATGSNANYHPHITVLARRNGRLTKEVELILDTGGPALAKVTTYEYNLAHEFTTGINLKAVNEYAYFEVAQSSAQADGIDSFPTPAQWLRRTEHDYLDDADATYRNRNLLGLKAETRVKNSAGVVVARTQVRYDEPGYYLPSYGPVTNWADPGTFVRGNPTTLRSYAAAASAIDPNSACPAGVCIDSHTEYDLLGNVTGLWDGNGNKTTTAYSPAFAYAYPTSVTTAAPNAASVPNPAGGFFGPGTFGSTAGHTAATDYDFNTGRVTSATDINGKTTTFNYADPLNRLKAVTRPDGGTTTHEYGRYSNAGRVSDYIGTTTSLDSGRSVYSYQFFDGLGRPDRSFLYEGGSPALYLTTDTQYDTSGRVWRVSNPYRTTGSDQPVNPSGLWTTTEFDALGRTWKVTTPDGAKVYSLHDGNRTLVTDQAQRQQISKSDALGRLTDVWDVRSPDAATGTESVSFPVPQSLASAIPAVSAGYRTAYTHDAQGNVRTVTQGAQPARVFNYDSLSRLTSAFNPESGTITYAYDANGNLEMRTDARGVQSRYRYDGLNRNIVTSYANDPSNTLTVLRKYDFGVNGKGLPYLTQQSGSTTTATYFDQYDALGRPLAQRQKFETNGVWSADYQVSRTYNKAGGVTSQTYPSGRTVTYNYDAAGRLGDNGAQPAFKGTLGDGVERTYVSQVLYNEQGGRSQERFGTQTPVYNKSYYNVRGQLTEIRVATTANDTFWNRGAIINHYSDFSWAGSGADNNGSLRKQDVYIPNDDQISGWSLTTFFYGYDALNRLDSVREVRNGADQWRQQYDYDRWGNRTINAAATQVYGPNPTYTIPEPQFSVIQSTNRLGVPAGQSGRMDYDAAGNLVNDSYSPGSYGSPTGAQTRSYDAEGRMVSAQTSASQTAVYVYDGDGRRVRRLAGTAGEVWHVYGIGGALLAEYASGAAPTAPQKEYGYRGAGLLVTAEASASTLTNVSQGKPATQSTTGWGGVAALAVDGNTSGVWDHGSVSHTNGDPQGWWQVDLQSVQQISRVDFFLMTECCSAHGDFDVKVSDDGVNWSSYYVAGPVDSGSVTANRTGRYVRVQLRGTDYLALAEVQVWAGSGGAGGVNWLVSDQLGTPRMVLDKTGSLAGVRRHDYLPFGEELFAGVGQRTTAQGYSAFDNVRQKFTGYERDAETALDHAGARYYSSAQGRFTSPDPLSASGKPGVPQSWNRYTYCLNHPLLFVDPEGLIWGKKESDPNYKWFDTEEAMKAEGYAAATRFVYDIDGVWYSVNPKANEYKTFRNDWDARVQFNKWVGLQDSRWDYVPFVRGARSFLFNYTIGDHQAAFGSFVSLSFEGGTGGTAGRLAAGGKTAAKSLLNAADDGVYLYHGARSGIRGGEYSLEAAKAFRDPARHMTSDDVAVFFTDDLQRAATQYATPGGQVGRSWVSREFAESIKQYDRYGNLEFKATTQGQLDVMNGTLEIKSQRNAIINWWLGK